MLDVSLNVTNIGLLKRQHNILVCNARNDMSVGICQLLFAKYYLLIGIANCFLPIAVWYLPIVNAEL